MIAALPYTRDSAGLFASWAQQDWAIFLDSGHPANQQGRFDILVAQPYKTLVTRGSISCLQDTNGSVLSTDDPFKLLRKAMGPVSSSPDPALPFCGGAVGYFGYDLARRLETLPSYAHDGEQIPDMMVGLYDWAVIVDHQSQTCHLVSAGRDPATQRNWHHLIDAFTHPDTIDQASSVFTVDGPIQANMTADTYRQAFDKILHYLREGDCYQVNLAQRFSADCSGNPWLAYQELRQRNAAPFSAYLNTPAVQILSSSPERFLKVHNRRVETKPIKGTRPRCANLQSDQAQKRRLKASLKDRAENLMIVDLLRNDISKACRLDSVQVPKLFEIESFATVHHLVSTVCGELDTDKHAIDLLRACFPGGSITGAPKVRAMEIIEELEPHRRGVYCGSVGYISFDGNMDSNIAIRTLIHSDNRIRFWAGGGIVADSTAESEYQESFDKASALLQLLESMSTHTQVAS